MKEVNVILNENQKELVIRTGAAEVLRDPTKLEISGNIDAPRRFKAVRGKEITAEKSLVTVNRQELRIILTADTTSHFSTVITGEMEINEDLQGFSINANKRFSREDLASFLKLNRIFFKDRDAHAKLISAIKTLKADVSTSIEQSNDNRGNRANNFDKKVTANDVPLNFVLEMPIFKGDYKKSFVVDVCFDILDARVIFWLESVDMAELIIESRDEIFNNELKAFEGLTIIEL